MGEPVYKFITNPDHIHKLIRAIISKENHIGFAILDNKIAVSVDREIFVILADKVNDDLNLLINSENIDKIVFSKSNVLERIRRLFGEVSCNCFIDLYEFSESKNKLQNYKDIQQEFKDDITRADDINEIMGLEAFFAQVGYDEINDKVTYVATSFNAFCLFHHLNIINSELSKRNKPDREELFDIIRELPPNIPIGKRISCQFNDEIYPFLVDNNILMEKGNRVKIDNY